MDENAIEFWATIAQVRTMADGGLRVVLDLPESAIMQAAQLMEYKRVGIVLEIIASPCKAGLKQSNGESEHELETRTKRQSTWEAAEESGLDRDTQQSGEPHA